MIWTYIVLSYISLFVLGIADNIRGPLFPEVLSTFQLSDSKGALFFAVSSFGSIFGSLIVTALLKKITRLTCLQIASFLMAGGLFLIGLGTSFEFVLVGAFIFGFSIGMMTVVQNTLVAIGSKVQQRKQYMSGLHSMYGFASLLSPLVVTSVLHIFPDWRQVFKLVALLPLLVAMAIFAVNQKEFEKSKSMEGPSQAHPTKRSWLGRPLLLAMMLGLYVGVEILISTRLPLFMRREFGYNLEQAGVALSYFFVCLLAGRFLFAVKSFKFVLKQQLAISLFATLICILIGLYGSHWFLALSGFTMAPFYPLCMVYLAERFPNRVDETIGLSASIQGPVVVGMHAGIGLLTEIVGIKYAILIGTFALVGSFFLLYYEDGLEQKEFGS